MQLPRPHLQRPIHSPGDSDADILRVPEWNAGCGKWGMEKLSTLGTQAQQCQKADGPFMGLFRELSEVWLPGNRRLPPLGNRMLFISILQLW